MAAYLDVLDAASLDLAPPVVQAIAATVGLRSSAPAPVEGLGMGKPARHSRRRAAATPKAAPTGR